MSETDDLRKLQAGDLQKMTIEILRSAPCQRIRFKNVVSVTGFNYGYVADTIEGGYIKVEVDEIDPIAEYHWSSFPKKIIFRVDAWSRINKFDMAAIGSTVHEATHALADAVGKGRFLNWRDNEVTAYLAEAIYLLNSSYTASKVADEVGSDVCDLAQTIREFRGPRIYECTESETRQIRGGIERQSIRRRPGLKDFPGFQSEGIPWEK
jgi:hypothetical protein